MTRRRAAIPVSINAFQLKQTVPKTRLKNRENWLARDQLTAAELLPGMTVVAGPGCSAVWEQNE